jgi:hypothetical protein
LRIEFRHAVGAPVQGAKACVVGTQARRLYDGRHGRVYASDRRVRSFRFHRWRANLRILDIEELKSVPFVPRSHPFIERPIGTLRRGYLDQTFFWNSLDLHC